MSLVGNNDAEASPAAAGALQDATIEVDWRTVVAELRASAPYAASDHTARTVAKHPGIRLVVVAMKQGGSMPEHQASAPITLQVLEGRARCDVGGKAVELEPGRVVLIAQDLPHSVTALEESAFLLTVGELHRSGTA